METVRNYAPVLHEYLEEMKELSDAEFGRLIRSLLAYSRDGIPIALNGNERFFTVRVMNCEDRFQQAFKTSDETRSAAGKAAAHARWNKNASACDDMRTDANGCDRIRSDAIDAFQTKPNQTKPSNNTGENAPAHKRGEYGWVKLTDAQYEKLLKDLGQEELERCIRYVDESAQNTRNRNGWKDWNLTIRKCSREGWGLKGQQQKPKQYTTAEQYQAPKSVDADQMEEIRRQFGI